MKRTTKLLLSAGATISIGLVLFLGLRPILLQRTSVSYVTRAVGYTDISSAVAETGTVNPVDEVQVGSEVSGTISLLNADYNSNVRAGEVLAALDPTSFKAAVSSADASRRLALANLANAKLAVQKTKNQYDLAQLIQARDEPLVKQGMMAQSQLDSDATAARSAYADYLSAQGTVEVAQAQITVAEAQVNQAAYNLDRTVIRSPIDGVVLARNVSVGQTVSASLQAPTLFVIASDLTDLEVDTQVDEADVGAVKSGQRAHITVTAFPNAVFEGTVEEVRVDPTTVQNVVTYDAIVKVRDPTGRLLPGMTAQVTIVTGSRNHALSVPLAALLFQPSMQREGPARGSSFSSPARPGGTAASRGAGGQRPQSPSANGAPQIAGAPGSQVRVWVLRDGRPAPELVTIGLSDEQNVELTGGALHAGDQVIIAERKAAGR